MDIKGQASVKSCYEVEKMAKIIAACGNDCSACPRFVLPPFEKTEEQLSRTAELWRKIGFRNRIVSTGEIACTGCKPENLCRYHIAACCQSKSVQTCAECTDYPCEKSKDCFQITKSFESVCQRVCTPDEYGQLKTAFFEKEENLFQRAQMPFLNRPDQKTVFFSDRSQWRNWLTDHFETETEVWFVFPSVASGEKGVSYNDAVEEALCFGWIDGQAGTLDKNHQLRRFTPRRKGSSYSQSNIERLIFLDSQGMIHPKVRPSVEEIIRAPFLFPEDILDTIRQDAAAWRNYQTFSEPYKRIRIAYIDAARKRPAEFEKRLRNFIGKTKENKLIIGYGGVDKYYSNQKTEKENGHPLCDDPAD